MLTAELVGLTTGHAVADVGHAIRESIYMLWDTLWALVLGFALSGAVQAFVPSRAMRRALGDHRPASVVRASLLGMASSSCSYAASAMARSLVARGADYLAAMVFMVASTNLVVELGIVLAVLIGWQFVVAELAGGIIMIVLLVALGSLWLRGRALDAARARLESEEEGAGEEGREHWRVRIRTAAGWSDAAGYTVSDLRMLRRELLIGFVAAGLLTVLVPDRVWADVFVRGHGGWTNVENAVVGPLVALASCVCSIGNVPLAAALWKGGISFGGVVAFVFADLIAFPLLLVYRKQYGTQMAARMLACFWAVMAAAGLATGYLFRAAGLVPRTRPGVVVGDTFRWDPTTALDIVALAVLAVLCWLSRHQSQLGGGAGYARDPVCGMQVEAAGAPASTSHRGARIFFCSEHCRDRFEAAPDRFAREGLRDG